MKKSQNLKSSKDGRLHDGGMRFVVRLPKDISDLFELEMKKEDRKKLPMARFIITAYFRSRQQLERATEEEAQGPHFGGKSSLRQRVAD